MKVSFDGTPAEVVSQMKEYITRTGFEFSTEPVVKKPPLADIKIPPEFERETAEVVEVLKAAVADMKDPLINQCQFCKKTRPTIRGRVLHEKSCRSNPNFVPHEKRRRDPLTTDYVNGRFDQSTNPSRGET